MMDEIGSLLEGFKIFVVKVIMGDIVGQYKVTFGK
jgi:hypothetical protein